VTINEIFQKFPNKRTIEHIEDNFAFNREDAIRLLKILLKGNKYRASLKTSCNIRPNMI
jgi:hypothetical protein